MNRTGNENRNFASNYSAILLFFMFIIGMIYGVLLIKSNSDTLESTISVITNEYTVKLEHQSIVKSFTSSFSSIFIFILLPYLFGYSAIFQPLIILVPWFKGLGLGFFMANLYVTYGIKGIGFCTLVIIPSTLVAIFCIIIACREALRLSNLFFLSFASKRQAVVSLETIKLYNLKMLVICAICIGASILGSLCTLLFSGMFNFM